MVMEATTIWLAALTALFGLVGILVGLLISSYGKRIDSIETNAVNHWEVTNNTRQEMAKEYATKIEVHNDYQNVMSVVNQVDQKIDRLIEIELGKGKG